MILLFVGAGVECKEMLLKLFLLFNQNICRLKTSLGQKFFIS